MILTICFWSAMVALVGSTAGMLYLEKNYDANQIPKWLWWTATALFFGGAALLIVTGIAITVHESIHECVVDQSALAGVCVPIDQAG